MFWRIFYGFLRFTGLAQCFAGGYPCCCTTSGSTSSKPPPGSSRGSSATIACSGCSIGSQPNRGARDLQVEISGITDGACSICEDLNGTFIVPFYSSGGTTNFSCNWSLNIDVNCGAFGRFIELHVDFFGTIDTGTGLLGSATLRVAFIKSTHINPIALTLQVDHASGWFDIQELRDCVNWVGIPLHASSNDGDGKCLAMPTPATATVTAL